LIDNPEESADIPGQVVDGREDDDLPVIHAVSRKDGAGKEQRDAGDHQDQIDGSMPDTI
jgi:hypothetical protein